eukprot:TRINITY_DN1278_c0_g1_i1.p1 TRINITY_DN1278_c0_g1~~TRINITY_DN1278_c0_g1_i1.p1  ORF type:complete len:147 (+),score=88.93 TRINITY_DN1278_c0_g1_i1:124-564(+)
MVDRQLAQEIFSLFDLTNCGAIPVTSIVTGIGAYGLNPTQAEIDGLIAKYDPQSSGQIDFEAFCGLITENAKLGKNKKEIFEEAFRVFDKEQDGTLSISELRQVLMNLGEKANATEVDDFIQAASSKFTPEGRIQYIELVKIIIGK